MGNVVYLNPPACRGVLVPVFGDSPPLPIFLSHVSAGFTNAAEDYVDKRLKLEDYCVLNPSATYFARIAGDSMTGAGILDGDLAVIDRSTPPKHKDIVSAIIDGEIVVRRLYKRGAKCGLIAENPIYPAIWMDEGQVLQTWGVVRFVVHKTSL